MYLVSAPAETNSSMDGMIGNSETVRFRYEFPQEGLTVRICTQNGVIQTRPYMILPWMPLFLEIVVRMYLYSSQI